MNVQGSSAYNSHYHSNSKRNHNIQSKTPSSHYCSNEVRTANYRGWHWYVYIIECKDGLYYTGMTYNTNIRFEQHKSGFGSKFSSKHGFKEVKYIEEFKEILEAREREHQLKDFSRKKKEALWQDY